jgi:hypothetical protein
LVKLTDRLPAATSRSHRILAAGACPRPTSRPRTPSPQPAKPLLGLIEPSVKPMVKVTPYLQLPHNIVELQPLVLALRPARLCQLLVGGRRARWELRPALLMHHPAAAARACSVQAHVYQSSSSMPAFARQPLSRCATQHRRLPSQHEAWRSCLRSTWSAHLCSLMLQARYGLEPQLFSANAHKAAHLITMASGTMPAYSRWQEYKLHRLINSSQIHPSKPARHCSSQRHSSVLYI